MKRIGFGKDNRGAILKLHTNGGALSTLAATTALELANLPIEEDFRLLKMEISVQASWSDDANSAILLLACGELSMAEIANAMTVDGPVDRNDNLQMGYAERPAWVICRLSDYTGLGASDNLIYNNGLPYTWKKRWTFSAPEGFSIVAYNPNAFPLVTGSSIQFEAIFYGVWVT